MGQEGEMFERVVQYVDPLMGQELLSKFPDYSAYDFDYSQSSLWSPLVPRKYPSSFDLDVSTPRKLSCRIGGPKLFANITNACFRFDLRSKFKIKKPLTPCSRSKEGWKKKALKVASKSFKKKKEVKPHKKKPCSCTSEPEVKL